MKNDEQTGSFEFDLSDSLEITEKKDNTPKSIQKEISKNKSLVQMSKDELKYVKNSPIGNAIYTKRSEEKNIAKPKNVTKCKTCGQSVVHKEPPKPKEKPAKEPYHWKQKVECRHCGKIVNKGSYSAHRKTQKCKIHQELDEKYKAFVTKK